MPTPTKCLLSHLRRTFGGTFIVNSGFSRMTTRDEVDQASVCGGGETG